LEQEITDDHLMKRDERQDSRFVHWWVEVMIIKGTWVGGKKWVKEKVF
jgi:hypothetical protein